MGAILPATPRMDELASHIPSDYDDIYGILRLGKKIEGELVESELKRKKYLQALADIYAALRKNIEVIHDGG